MTYAFSRNTLVALVFCVSGTALAATIPPGVELHAKQELVRNNDTEPESLDPALVSSVPANNIIRDLFEGLTATESSGKVVPGVAESWNQTDARTWVFNLRKDARWSNGDPLTADDFIYGLRRFVDPSIASPYATTFGIFIKNGIEIAEGKMPPSELGVKAIDKYTLEITTPYPTPFLPEIVTNLQFGPIHRATVEKYGKEWTKPGNIVGNGAFILSEWQVNSKIVLRKNPRYWDAKNVQLTKWTYLPIEDNNADLKLYESGENDWVAQLPLGTYEKYKAKYPNEVHNTPVLSLSYYSPNNQDPLLKDVRVRKALSMTIDRDILAKKVTTDGERPAYSVIIAGTNGADPTTYDWVAWPMEQRVAEARKLLVSAGVKPGTKIKFAYNTSDYHKKVAIFASSEWKTKLGIELELEAMEFKVLLKRRGDGEFQMARNGWVGDYNDATTFLTLVQCGSAQNSERSCNRKAEELIDQGNMETDAAKRKALLTQATKMIMDDYPLIPLLQSTATRLIKPYVGGYSDSNILGHYRGKDLYVIKH